MGPQGTKEGGKGLRLKFRLYRASPLSLVLCADKLRFRTPAINTHVYVQLPLLHLLFLFGVTISVKSRARSLHTYSRPHQLSSFLNLLSLFVPTDSALFYDDPGNTAEASIFFFPRAERDHLAHSPSFASSPWAEFWGEESERQF